MSPPPTTRRRRDQAWLRKRPEVQAMMPGGRAETQIGGAPVEVLGLARSRHLSRSLAAAGSHGQRLGQSSPRRCRLRQRTAWPAALEPRLGDRIEIPAPSGDWTARGRRHLCRLRQPQGPDRRQCRSADPALSRRSRRPALALRVAPADVPALMSALRDKFGLDGRNLLDQATVKAESHADLQPDLRGHRRAQRLHARRWPASRC